MGMIRPRPKIKSKDVTITENGESVIKPDKYFDGMSQVNLNVDVAGGETVYLPKGIKFSNTSVDMSWLEKVDTSLIEDMSQFFSYNNTMINAPMMDTQNVTNMSSMFIYCSLNLKSVPLYDTRKVTTFAQMFTGCGKLESVPVFDMTSIVKNGNGYKNMFKNCSTLTNDSLNNILQMCINCNIPDVYSGQKTLLNVGLSQEQATTCQSLSNYQAFLDAGWTTGY